MTSQNDKRKSSHNENEYENFAAENLSSHSFSSELEEEISMNESLDYDRSHLENPQPNFHPNTFSFNNQYKKKYRVQKFKQGWLNEPNFKSWLLPSKTNDAQCQCRVCPNKFFLAKLSVIEKHSISKKHLLNLENSCILPSTSENKSNLDFQTNKATNMSCSLNVAMAMIDVPGISIQFYA